MNEILKEYTMSLNALATLRNEIAHRKELVFECENELKNINDPDERRAKSVLKGIHESEIHEFEEQAATMYLIACDAYIRIEQFRESTTEY